MTRAYRPKLYFRSRSKSRQRPEHPCPNHNSVCVSEHAMTRASMPKSYFRSRSKSMRRPEHPGPNHSSVHVPRAVCDHQSIHAQNSVRCGRKFHIGAASAFGVSGSYQVRHLLRIFQVKDLLGTTCKYSRIRDPPWTYVVVSIFYTVIQLSLYNPYITLCYPLYKPI